MNVYVVVKRGVYRHDIVGVLADLPTARLVAEGAARSEDDAYHDFEIVECVLGQTGERLVAKVVRSDALRGVCGDVTYSENGTERQP